MQALSFVVHIPLVCFGIAFPALVLFVEWLYLRTGDELYRTLARRWTKVMAALFAAGVVTGTILSFEMGLLWPDFTASFGSVFGLGFAIEGFSFFMEAIFIGIYIYGWDRLSPRAHFASGIPIAIAGFTGSLTVISVNGWMNHPTGFHLREGKAVDVHPVQALFGNSYFWHELVHMYLAGYMVTGFLVAAAYAAARLRGRWGRYERTALAIPLTVAALCCAGAGARRRLERARGGACTADQARCLRRARRDETRGARAPARLVQRRPGRVRDPDPAAAFPARLPRPERERRRPRRRAGGRAPARQRRPHRLSDDGRDRDTARPARPRLSRRSLAAQAATGVAVVLPCACRWRGRSRSSR